MKMLLQIAILSVVTGSIYAVYAPAIPSRVGIVTVRPIGLQSAPVAENIGFGNL